MKLYAITRGDYSDYHICAITAHRGKADRLKIVYSDGLYDARIEEFEDGEGEDLYLPWICDQNGCGAKLDRYPDQEKVYVDSRTKEIIGVQVYAKDAEHAERKAHDMIAEYKARQAGIC